MHPTMLLAAVLRPFRHHPLYAFACAATLALAVGTATATAVVARRAFLDPLPYLAGDALVSVYTETRTWPDAPVSPQVVTEIEADGPFAAVVALEPHAWAYATGDVTRQVLGLEVTPSFFTALARPALGRVWADGERDVAIVSDGFWREELGSDPAAVGRTLLLDGTPRTVVGVLAPVPAPYWPDAAVLTPLDMAEALATQTREQIDFSVVARLADGATVEGMNAWLDGYAARVNAEYPGVHAGQRWYAESLRTELVGEARPALIGLGLAAGLLLLIVCANIAGLSAALAVALRQRLALQGALGATRGRLLRERLGGAAVIATIGAAGGVWLADALVGAMAAFQPYFMGRMPTVVLDAGTAAAGFAGGAVAGVVAAMIPFAVTVAGRLDPLPSARGSSRGRDFSAFRAGLVVSQVAFALVLIVGAGLLVRTMGAVSGTPLGYRTEGLHTASTNLNGPRYAEPEAQIAFERRVIEELAQLPGAAGATASIGIPILGGSRAPFAIAGRDEQDGRGEVAYMSLAPGFLRTWDVRLLEGRDFADTDVEGGPGAIVINETMARRYWPDGGALGARIWIGGDGPPDGEAWMTVVGIVADVRQHGPVEDVLPTAFGSTRQYSWAHRVFTLRMADGAPPLPAGALEAAVHRVDPQVPVAHVRGVDRMLAEATVRQRLTMLVLVFLGAVAAVLSAFGLYAVVSLTSRLRRREYAIRLAVGAQPGSVRRMVVREGVVLALAGATLGVLLATAGTRALEGMLVGVSALDGITFATAVAAVLALAVGAAWGPANRAGRTEAVEILNTE